MGVLLSFFFNCRKEALKVTPTLSVAELATVTGTTATIKIGVISDGGAAITERGVCWNTSPNPTINDNKTIVKENSSLTGLISPIKAGLISDANTSSEGSIAITISDLLPNKTYYIRAYAINTVGVGYSDELSITTLTLAPGLTTLELTGVTSTAANSGGNIADDGGAEITARGVCWSTNQNPTIADSKTTNGTGSGSFTSSITGLTTGATYYIRAYATNSIGTSYGNQLSLTVPSLPVITLNPISDYTATIANCSAEITSDGGSPVTERGFVRNTSPNPTTSDYWVKRGTGSGSFTGILDLLPNTTYYVRAYAKTSNGTAYSNQETFTTPVSAPSLLTNVLTNITATTATSGGRIYYDGGREITAKGVCWNTSDYPTIADFKTNDGTGPANFTSPITGLTPGRAYFLRAYATNSVGTSYGNRIVFNTPLESCNNCEIVKIKYGTSFNNCVNYCRRDLILSLSEGTTSFTKQGFSGIPAPLTCTGILSDTIRTPLKTGVDITTFYNLPAVIGCPDCSDGGSEWIELELNHGETHRANWDFSAGAPASIKDYVNRIRNQMNYSYNNCP